MLWEEGGMLSVNHRSKDQVEGSLSVPYLLPSSGSPLVLLIYSFHLSTKAGLSLVSSTGTAPPHPTPPYELKDQEW